MGARAFERVRTRPRPRLARPMKRQSARLTPRAFVRDRSTASTIPRARVRSIPERTVASTFRRVSRAASAHPASRGCSHRARANLARAPPRTRPPRRRRRRIPSQRLRTRRRTTRRARNPTASDSDSRVNPGTSACSTRCVANRRPCERRDSTCSDDCSTCSWRRRCSGIT